MINEALVAVPLFIFMGVMLERTKIAAKLLESIGDLFGSIKGGLGIGVVLVGMLLAASTGIVGATVVTMGIIALPTMLKHNYSASLASGTIAASGTLGQIIPPSIILILLGDVMGVPVGRLFVGSIVPGLLLVTLFMVYILIYAWHKPSVGPAFNSKDDNLDFIDLIKTILPPFTLILAVLGSIFFGIATPTESAAIGCMGAFLISIFYRSLSFSALQKALLETAKVSSMILFIIVASVTFSQILAFSGATDGLLKTIQEIATSQFTILLMMISVLLILGAFMDQVSMVMITIPFFIPLAQFQEIDLLWLCVLMLIVMEISFTTPPFGLLLYVMKGVAPKEITLRQIYLAALPFIMLEFLVLIYLIIEPNTALYLPSLIKTGLGRE